MADQEPQDSGSPAGAIAGLVSDNLEKVAEQSRALLVLAGIVAIAALGLAVAVHDRTGQILGLAVFLALMLLITALLYLTSRVSTGGDEQADHATVANALALVNGKWWQLVVNDDSPGLTVITVALSVLPTRHHLSGTKYGPDGKEGATWWSRAVGLLQLQPVEVFYYWQGAYSRESAPVSGVGVFEFPATPGERPKTGGGWFTTGDVDRGDFSISSRVHLRRVDADDQSILDRGGAEREALLRSRYEDWVEELGVSAAVHP
jgi:hypothetical protein